MNINEYVLLLFHVEKVKIYRIKINTYESVEQNNSNFDVILVMCLFTMLNMLKTHKNTQKDAILLFKVGQILVQTL